MNENFREKFIMAGILIILATILFKEVYYRNQVLDESNFQEELHMENALFLENNLYNESSIQKENTALVKEFKEISRKYYVDIPISVIKDYYGKIGPFAMLDVIEEDENSHSKCHNVGRVVFIQTSDINKAMHICRNRCTTGCFHGILMEMFKENTSYSYEHIELEKTKESINTICNKREINSHVKSGACIHGLGHAFLSLADYNISTALTYCNLFRDKGSIYYCATGVFMERDIVYGNEDKAQSDTHPCEMFDNFTIACYRYKIRRVFPPNTDFREVAKFCLELDDTNERRGCFHGLGFGFYRYVYNNPKLLPSLCSYGDDIEQRMCIEGAIGFISILNIQIAKDACANLNKELNKICMDTINISNFIMFGTGRDFNLYLPG